MVLLFLAHLYKLGFEITFLIGAYWLIRSWYRLRWRGATPDGGVAYTHRFLGIEIHLNHNIFVNLTLAIPWLIFISFGWPIVLGMAYGSGYTFSKMLADVGIASNDFWRRYHG